jgi:CSLREA domain-containing protein
MKVQSTDKLKKLLMGVMFVLLSTIAVKAATYTVTKTADTNGTCNSGVDCSLREAIAAANVTPEADIINFNIPTTDSGCSGGVCVITLSSSFGQLTINSASSSGTLTITNEGGSQKIEISGNNNSRVFLVNSGANLTLNNVTIRDGRESGGSGGGIRNFGTLTVINSTIRNCFGGAGGSGVYSDPGSTITIINSTISNNSAGANGGGILNNGTAIIINSTISNNSAGSGGGGINNGGTATIINSTISNNSAGSGGGILNGGTVTIINSTISNNSAFGGGGILNSDFGTVNARNAIIANNSSASSGPDFFGTLTSQGYNLIGNTSGTTITGTTTGNILNQDPKLAPLGDYGGLTKTHALLPGSPALNAGNNCVLTQGGCGSSSDPPIAVNVDQRGNSRTTNAGGNVDIGAYEQRYGVVTNTNDSGAGSLRDEATSQFGGLISFNISGCPGGTCVITLSSQITINRVVILTNEGGSQRIEISGNNAVRVFQVSSGGNLTINSLTIRNGGTGTNGGGILNSGGTLTVINSTIRNNSAASGGGSIFNNGTATIINSTISNNFVGSFGFGGGIDNGGTITIINSTISNNRATANGGGGINNSGTVTVINSTISNNSAGEGGGIRNDGTVNARNTIIANNSASSGPDFRGTLNSQGYNLIGNTSGTTITGTTTGNILNQDPKLAPLGDYGGPTQTHALLLGSPALNAGNNSLATDQNGNPLATDQRGAARVANGIVDIGAYEQRYGVVTNTSNSGAGSLRDEATSQFGGLISFNIPASSCSGGTCVITLSSQITINRAVILTNEGGSQKIEISGNNTVRVFEVSSGGNLTVNSLTIRNGFGAGGGIFNNGGTATIINSTINNNSAGGGGGGGGILNAGTATIINSTISNNSAGGGGGIYNIGTTTIISSTVTNNSADGALGGGGILNAGGTVNARNTIIANNSGTPGLDFLGTINSQGSNLIKNTSGTSGVTSADITGQDPLLTPLGYYGGPTLTRAVFGKGWFRRTFSDSPVVDAGDSCVQVLNCASNNPAFPITTDQRGARRGKIDIGAYEVANGFKAVLPNGTNGQSYDFTITTYNTNEGNFTYTMSGLPSGLSLSQTVSGSTVTVKIAGTPVQTGSFNPVLTITSGTQTTTVNYSLVIQ